MRWLILLLLLPLAGCLDCEPKLEIRNCLDGHCEGSDDAMFVVWNETHAQDWPELDGLFGTVPYGDHHHQGMTGEEERAFWDAWGVTGDKPELIIDHGEDRFRIRILTCG